MADIIRYEINIPQRFEIAHPVGVEKEGQYGVQFQHRTCDGRLTYLEPIVEQQLDRLGIVPGEEIEICKRQTGAGNSRRIQWTVQRVREILTQEPKEQSGERKALSAPTAPSVNNSTQITNSPQGSSYEPRITQGAAARVMATSLKASIDALIEAQAYAAGKGVDFKMTEDKVVSVGISMFIQSFKEAETRLRYPATRSTREQAA
ncbi:MAG: hypothetical protein M3N41_10230 [Acidobacteriota bacterium]|nr:hypothetical protein [Acidobacteriota bacterium]